MNEIQHVLVNLTVFWTAVFLPVILLGGVFLFGRVVLRPFLGKSRSESLVTD